MYGTENRKASECGTFRWTAKNEKVEENNCTGGVVVAMGISDFANGTDLSFQQVFERADGLMYIRKKELKQFKS